MQDDPRVDLDVISRALRAAYRLEPRRFRFRPGYDARAAAYELETDAQPAFVKVFFDGVDATALEVPAALAQAGVAAIPAPLRTLSGELSVSIPLGTLVAMPFVAGRTAAAAGMPRDAWARFGTVLRAVHDSGLAPQFGDRLRMDRFDGTAAADARRAVAGAVRDFATPGARAFGDMLGSHRSRIEAMADRMEAVGAHLRASARERVLCHADIHAANIVVADDGQIALVDWDGAMIAPRERDLLFIIGSRIARPVEPHEEAWFFEGYGDVAIDADAIRYYRYERILEDVAEFAREVLDDPSTTEPTRLAHTALVDGFFAPDGIVQSAESVVLLPSS